MDSECSRVPRAIGRFLKELQIHGLVTDDPEFPEDDLDNIFWAVRQLPKISPADFPCTVRDYHCACLNDVQTTAGSDLTRRLKRKALGFVNQKSDFVCLDCAKSPGSDKPRRCRMGHDGREDGERDMLEE